MSPARPWIGWAVAGAVVVVGLAYPYVGTLVGALAPDPDGCEGSRELPTASNANETRRATLCLLNARRAAAGLEALRPSAVLARSARRHSVDMGVRRFFAHDSPDGTQPVERVAAAGYPRAGVVVGENLAWGEETAGTPAEIVRGWMKSPGHRANILRAEFEEVGIGLGFEPPTPARGQAVVYTTNFGGSSG
jgi:uncharacterized protein YkwD